MPVTRPDDEFAEAKAELLLVHTPPGVPFRKVEETVVHKLVVPVIAPGARYTVNTLVELQPDGIV